MRYGEILEYSNELEDEVVDFRFEKVKIDKNYKYINRNVFVKFFSNLSFRLAFPFVFLYFKAIKRVSYKNTKTIKKFQKNGYFIYGNHTNALSDAVSPSVICFPKMPHVIADSSNLSIPIVGKIIKHWGVMPLPHTIDATKNFYLAMEHFLKMKEPIVIYPEAHLWPYYTKIRPYSALSFRYPITYNKPVFTFTTTYKLKKPGKKPKTTIYVDGPFFPDLSLSNKDAQKKLRDQVYNQMLTRAKESDYEFLTYKKRSNND